MKKINIDSTIDQIAKLVIELHEEGYNDDFELYGDSQLWDAQENRGYVFDEIKINKICQVGQHDRKAAKFILAIETTDGCKGLLVGVINNGFF
jgi:hypothetical protein